MFNRFKRSSQDWHSAGERILVTGCSSGIGRATAIHLAKSGFTVFATSAKSAMLNSRAPDGHREPCAHWPARSHAPNGYSAGSGFCLARNAAARQRWLYAIVNNAGGGSIAPIELMDIAKFQLEAETRLVGPVALLQAFLPLIRRAHGRIVWIVTPALMPIPYVSSIHTYDFAANCLARTLQLELKPWNIPSIQVRCGGINTAAPAKTDGDLAASFRQWPPEQLKLYAAALE